MRRCGILRVSTGLLVAVLWFAAATAAARDLRIGISQFPTTLHPNIEAMLAKTYVQAMTRRPLTAYDQDWRLICMLCTEVPSLENGRAVREALPDEGEGIAATYSLRDDATWGDGTPITTADIVFTWEVGRHPQSGVANAELYQRIRKVEVVDEKTFVFHFDRVLFNFAEVNDFRILPAHIERPIFEAEPVEYRNRTAFDSDPTNPALYFGPYRIAEIESGSHITLAKNPTWWGESPAFERIVVRTIENTAALEANLLSGAIDMIAGELGLTADQAIAFERRHGERFTIINKPGLIYEHIDLNLDNPILADRRVRQALIQALDREAISEQLFAGRQPVAHAFVSPLDWIYDDSVRRYPFDPAAAVALLEEAGWQEVRKGFRHNADGERLSLELMTTAGNRSRELVEQVIQSQLRQVGVEIRIRNEPARVFFGQTISQRKFTALGMFAWIASPENPPRTTLHSAQIPTLENNWSGQNYTGFANAEADRLIEAIEVELDRDQRVELWHQLQAIYVEELPVIPLYWRANTYILPLWLKGVRPTGHQDTTTLWVEEWRAE